MPKAKRPPGPGRGKVGFKALPTFNNVPTLSELGISKKDSAQTKKLAEIPESKITDLQTVAGRAGSIQFNVYPLKAKSELRTSLVALTEKARAR